MVFCHVKVAGHGRDALLRFEQAVRAHPEILECYTLMGETDFLLRIVCRDIKAYEAFFLDHLSRFPGVQSVNSSIALAVIKETTALPLRAGGAVSSASQRKHAARRVQSRHGEFAGADELPRPGRAAISSSGRRPFMASTRVPGAHMGRDLRHQARQRRQRAGDDAYRSGACGLKVSLRACSAVTLASPMRSAAPATKRIFLALPSMRVKRRCGFTTASGSPGKPAPVPTSAICSPARSAWMLRLSSRWWVIIASRSVIAVRLKLRFQRSSSSSSSSSRGRQARRG